MDLGYTFLFWYFTMVIRKPQISFLAFTLVGSGLNQHRYAYDKLQRKLCPFGSEVTSLQRG